MQKASDPFDVESVPLYPESGVETVHARNVPPRELSHKQVADMLQRRGHSHDYIRSYLRGRRQVIK